MTDTHQQIAARLREAYSGNTIPPLRDGLDPTDIGGAYAVQDLNTRYWISIGRTVVGRKVGLTSEVVQKQLGVDRPDFGVLFEDMRLPDGGVLRTSNVIQPRAEAEVALIIERELKKTDADTDDILHAASGAVAAIEIVDSRITDWKITFADTVADNGSSAFFVLGPNVKPLQGLDLRTCGMALEINGRVVSIGAGVACLGHPLNAAAWLARTLAELGEPLRAGDIILTGALGPMVALKPGDKVMAEIGGLGSVGFTYEESR